MREMMALPQQIVVARNTNNQSLMYLSRGELEVVNTLIIIHTVHTHMLILL